jgi:type I restriction enzyme S subunit
LFPEDVLIDKYFGLAKPIEDKRKNIFKENQKLTELRDWLLPMHMNGQVTLDQAKEYTLQNETLSVVAEGE